jgi:hypothetical protein
MRRAEVRAAKSRTVGPSFGDAILRVGDGARSLLGGRYSGQMGKQWPGPPTVGEQVWGDGATQA